jgi:tripartite-type tricarboxylate transporter receptor subunit TctC
VISSERCFAAPRGLPPAIAQRLATAIRLAVDDPEFLRGSSRDELALAYLSGPDWAASMAERKARYEAIWNGVAKP